MGQIDRVFAVDPNKSEGFEQWCDFADRPDINERCPRSQPDFGFSAPGSEEVDVTRVKDAVFTSGDVHEDSAGCHM